MDIKIEKAQTIDFKVIHALICEFSDFQNSRDRVSVTIDMMMEQKDFFNCYVARNSHREIIGYTSYSIIYYSWVGKSLGEIAFKGKTNKVRVLSVKKKN
jgi:diamine N-acetyltransferase